MKNKNRTRGYKAFSQGMVALAAGDQEEAWRQSKRAKALLTEFPLTRLLSAQAAQLSGDEKAASVFFEEMTEIKETELLGLRGLITQSMKDNDFKMALNLTRKAYALKPKSDWVSKNLFELQIRAGCWSEALSTSDALLKNGLLDKYKNKKRKCVLLYQLSLEKISDGNTKRRRKFLEKSIGFDPTFIPAVSSYAKILIESGKNKKAMKLIEKTWTKSPHPDLVPLYLGAGGGGNSLERFKLLVMLASYNLDHYESHVMKINAALNADLWGEARKVLDQFGDVAPEILTSQVCILWAELEKLEKQDVEKSHLWLRRATLAPSSEKWVCKNCKNTIDQWTIVCSNCNEFNSVEWLLPFNKNDYSTLGDSSKSANISYEIPTVK